ncbi:hypothetical protein JRQ81_009566 [Phrynocephalus forsythii]|uniref:Probable RNA-binding protein EIF1AD n=1 Tax=Phrynocephalus forsythii TaxID=171643 RepID=A0A9Q0XAJ9_9SAUR|nr:hypothetical protein JRQ81_009566 [Phrynocephalus forsythii]
MSQATKRKHVVKEVLEDYVVPSERQRIVRVLGTPGNNLHEVERWPPACRKNIWIKRGDFVLVDPIEEGEKVKAEISFVLYKDHVRYLKEEGHWPDAFLQDGAGTHSRAKESREGAPSPPRSAGEEDSEGDDDADLFVNTNRAGYDCAESEDSSGSEEEEEEEEEK